LTAAIIADVEPGEERADAQCPGLRVHCSATGKRVFFYRYRSQDGALREIALGDVGPLTLAKARDAALRKRLERQQGKDPQLGFSSATRTRRTVFRMRALQAATSSVARTIPRTRSAPNSLMHRSATCKRSRESCISKPALSG
jgi:Arm domain-containing DNA-binding protein